MAQRIVNKNTAWRVAGLENIERATNHNCGDTMGFEISCYQTPGLMTYGSHWDEQNGVHGLSLKLRA